MQFDGSSRTINGWIGWIEWREERKYIRSKEDIKSLYEKEMGIETINWYSCLENREIEKIKRIEERR